MIYGVWRSWLARSVRDAEVARSNRVTPTNFKDYRTNLNKLTTRLGALTNRFFLVIIII